MLVKPKYKILKVDLTSEKIDEELLDEKILRKFLGGAGFAAKTLWDKTTADTDPLSPENILIFGVGPVTGLIPSSSRLVVSAISPLTNIWAEGHAGGTWAVAFRRSGFMAIVIEGRATRPVYIWVRDGETKIVDAHHLWGKDTYEIYPILKDETAQKASIAAIGQAGENLVRFATVMTDGPIPHAAARCGLGAVMGSKNLKAVVTLGETEPLCYDKDGLRESIKRIYPKLRKFTKEDEIRVRRKNLWLKAEGSVRNFQLAEFESFDMQFSAMTDKYVPGVAKEHFCSTCRHGCNNAPLVFEGKHFNTDIYMFSLGCNCGIDDFEALYQAANLCNRAGLDSISIGDTMSFAMECFENGLITGDDTDGIELTWGNSEGMLQMLRKIINAEGIGKLLGLGTKRAAKEIGGIAPELAMHVKGLEIAPWHDPRPSNAFCLQESTSNIGAGHIDGFPVLYAAAYPPGIARVFPFTYIDDEKIRNAYTNKLAIEGQGGLVAIAQDYSNLFDSLVACNFLGYPVAWRRVPVDPSFAGIRPDHLAEWLNYVTGWDTDMQEVMRIGERCFNLKRLFNGRRGISSSDDTLPQRILTKKRGGIMPGAENLPPLGAMLADYYHYRGWNKEGVPTKEKLTALDLVEMVY